MATDTRPRTLEAFIATHGITAAFIEPADDNPQMTDDQDMDHWRVTLYCEERRTNLIVPFSMGKGHNGAQPTVEEVLDCMASDAQGFEEVQTFEEWADNYGYDSDSRKAKATFDNIERQSAELRSFLGEDAYQNLLFEVSAL